MTVQCIEGMLITHEGIYFHFNYGLRHVTRSCKMAADFRFPEALTSGSLLLPFMGLTGLDTTHNAVHRTIWEVFKDSKKDGKHKIHYRTFPLDHIYPKPSRDFVVRHQQTGLYAPTQPILHVEVRCVGAPLAWVYSNRVQRMNYESYTPVGILKKAWIDKHTQEVPSVLVVFYELDWDDPDWDAKKLECQSRVEVVRCCTHRLRVHVCGKGARQQEEVVRCSGLCVGGGGEGLISWFNP